MKSEQWGISREQALELMEQHLDTESIRKHCLASEAIMRALAPRFSEDPELWGLVGLLHDLDYNETRDRMEQHTIMTGKILRDLGVHEHVIEAIQSHNAENLGISRSKPIHFALTAAETITGLIVATALVYPDKKLASVKAKSLRKRMKEKEFARSVNRDHIRLCEQLGLPLDDFIEVSLDAMRGISDRLGL
ncbi:MAG: HDIG domain-containing metalloprotein [Thermodesulfobacteriota bacterium]